MDLALRRMQWIVMNCVDSRVVHSMGEWINCLLGIRKEDRGSSLELSVCELLTLIFRRLDEIASLKRKTVCCGSENCMTSCLCR